jgi:hypothetical protein
MAVNYARGLIHRHRINLNPRNFLVALVRAYAKSNYIIIQKSPSDHRQTGYNFVGLMSVWEYCQSVDT